MANGTNIFIAKPEPRPKKPRKPLRKFQTFGKAKESHAWLKRKSRIRPKSAKQAAKDRQWNREKRIALEACGGRCTARIAKDCNGVAEHPHHVRKRSHGGANHRDNCRWVCSDCHDFIERNPAAAARAGLSDLRKAA